MKRIYRCTRPPRHWHAFLAAVGILAYLLTSCAGSRAPLDTPEAPQAPRGVRIIPPQEGLPERVDSLTDADVGQSKPGFIAKALNKIGIGYKEKNTYYPTAFKSPAAIPRKCKGCQFVIQSGTGNTATQAATGKKGNSATGDGAKLVVAGKNSTQATDSAVAVVSGGGAAAVGAGARAEGGAIQPEAPDAWAVLADNATSWIPYVAGGAALLLGFWLWRKKKQANNLIS